MEHSRVEAWVERKQAQLVVEEAEYFTKQAVNKAELAKSWAELKLAGRESWFRLRHPLRAIRTWRRHNYPLGHHNLHILYAKDQKPPK